MQNVMHERIQKDIDNNDIVLFMKGAMDACTHNESKAS